MELTHNDVSQCLDADALSPRGTRTPLREADQAQRQSLSCRVVDLDCAELSLAKVDVALTILLGQVESVEALLISHQDHTSCVSLPNDFPGKREVGDILV